MRRAPTCAPRDQPRALRVQGEVEYPVPPLAEARGRRAVLRAGRAEPSDAIEELCARLDDLPLAIELAAARTSVLSPEQILERLSQRRPAEGQPRRRPASADPPRHHRVELRPPGEPEQRLFARLSVFRGGSSLASAEAVVDADLDALQSLVDKSLAALTGERFWMLETSASSHSNTWRGQARHRGFATTTCRTISWHSPRNPSTHPCSRRTATSG